MFDNNVFIKNTCKNVEEDNQVIGFELQTHITYYRGIPLSMVNYVRVAVDGVEVPAEDIRFTSDHIDWFTLKEMETVGTIKWEYGDPATIRVLKEGGLSKGEHDVKLTVCTRTAYIPIPLEGIMSRKVAIE
ncbi:C-glycoside deglycosidase beta subunit domain-containing protein [Enterococcus casseliflavus]|uniref:C-glycoside deglycosidase beta subunit domain-containing protein n=1 Tax=Enterococcus casseliflavus TaxID=37734 RepID=UPI00115EC32D|nr:DUF6379 domain-containing protein [Enterococcus casseliflavus]